MPRGNEESSPSGGEPSRATMPDGRPLELKAPRLVLRRTDSDGVVIDGDESSGPTTRILIVSSDPFWRARLGSAVRDLSVGIEVVETARGAREWMEHWPARELSSVPMMVIDIGLSDGPGDELAREAKARGFAAVLACQSPTLDEAVRALRVGVSDLFSRTTPMRDLTRRMAAALDRAVVCRRQEQRIVRLKRICRRLRTAREHVGRQVDSLCTDLVHAYQELAEHMNQVSTAAEFGSLIRQELDLESLLRSTLEFILSKTGPTNAAVFLPATSGDFSLGAYVNYDCPKDTIDILLDHMANAVAPRLQDVATIEHLSDRSQIDRYLEGDAEWIGDSHMIAFSCRHEGECLAIFLLFRDSKMSYGEGLLPQLKTVRDLFAAQLAKVIKIHHRHIPKEKWGALGDMDEPRGDDYGLAA